MVRAAPELPQLGLRGPAVHAVQRHYGIRTDRYKLIHFYNIDEWELYDLKRDPDELTNIYHDSQSQQVVSELKTELAKLREQYQVPEDTESVPGPGLTDWPKGQKPGEKKPAGDSPAKRRAG